MKNGSCAHRTIFKRLRRKEGRWEAMKPGEQLFA